jgi:hypothetical protein
MLRRIWFWIDRVLETVNIIGIFGITVLLLYWLVTR